MSSHPDDAEFDPEVRLRHLMEADARVLSHAATRLRRLGWLWIFLLATVFFITMAVAGGGRHQAQMQVLLAGFIVGIILIGVSVFYFALASYVEKGHRWAIGIALFLVSVFVTVLLWRIFTPRPMQLVLALMESLYLLGTLGLFKTLLQSWGAARRLHQFAQRQAVAEYGMVEDH